MKATGILTNVPELAEAICRRCDHSHDHGLSLGRVNTKEAAKFMPQFVNAALKGLCNALQANGSLRRPRRKSADHQSYFQLTSKDLQQSKEAGNFFARVLVSWLQENEEIDWELAHADGKPFAWAFPEYSAKLLTALPTEGQEAKSTVDAVDGGYASDSSSSSSGEEEERRKRPIGDLSDSDCAEDDYAGITLPKDKTVTVNTILKSLQKEIAKINRNLGHPGTEILVRALRHAGCKPEVISWARNYFKDPVRALRAKPKPPRPGALPRSLKFNQVIGCDLIFLEVNGAALPFINVVCWGTPYNKQNFASVRSHRTCCTHS